MVLEGQTGWVWDPYYGSPYTCIYGHGAQPYRTPLGHVSFGVVLLSGALALGLLLSNPNKLHTLLSRIHGLVPPWSDQGQETSGMCSMLALSILT